MTFSTSSQHAIFRAMIQGVIKDIEERVDKALERAGRVSEDVKILAVSKTISTSKISEVYGCGWRLIGESRVQEFESKKCELPNDIEWHFVGHLQTNKVKKIVGQVKCIHSLDSLRLADALNEEASKKEAPVEALVQINTSREATKFGFSPDELEGILDIIQGYPHLKLKGLMTIGPWFEGDGEAKKCREAFQLLRKLKERASGRFPEGEFTELSMGMSHDFEMAIEEGSTIIRLGTLLFGERK